MRNFIRFMAVNHRTSIIDVGGIPFVWNLAECQPPVTMINLRVPESIEGKVQMVAASGRAIPFADHSFDICFSNFVIEHVGDAKARADFSREVRRVATRYWVQTPNRHFFVEPHFICLFLHWLPFQVKRRLIRNFTVWGWVTRPSRSRVDEALSEISLLDEGEVKELFPDAEIIRERFLGMVKSLIAVKRV
jgi:Methyltransferase domain